MLNTRTEAKLGMGTFSRRDFTKLCDSVFMAGGAVASWPFVTETATGEIPEGKQ
jgi:hypothetical protein